MAWIAAGAAIIGGYMSNRASAKQASVARDEAGRYSGTAHQREVTDLRAAGLNPVLSGTGGAGASTPSGMVASQPADYSAVASKYLEAKRAKQEIKLLKHQTTSAGHMTNETLAREQIATMEAMIKSRRYPGEVDAAKLHSGWEGNAYRRAIMLGEGGSALSKAIAPLLPWGGHGRKGAGKAAMSKAKKSVNKQLKAKGYKKP